MAEWNKNNIVLTNSGRTLLANAQVGLGKIEITRVVARETFEAVNAPAKMRAYTLEDIPANTIAQTGILLEALVGVANPDPENEQVETSLLSVRFSNDELEDTTKWYNLRQIIVFARLIETENDTLGEVPYMVAQCTEENNPDYMPPRQTNPTSLDYDLYIIHSGVPEITVSLRTSGYVFEDTYNREVTQIWSAINNIEENEVGENTKDLTFKIWTPDYSNNSWAKNWTEVTVTGHKTAERFNLYNTHTDGIYSADNIATGICSHAEGDGNEVLANASHAEGAGNYISADSDTVSVGGAYNAVYKGSKGIVHGSFNRVGVEGNNAPSYFIVSGHLNQLNDGSRGSVVFGERNLVSNSPFSLITGYSNTSNNAHSAFITGMFNSLTKTTISASGVILSGSTNTVQNSTGSLINGNSNNVSADNSIVSGKNNSVSETTESIISGIQNVVENSACDDLVIGNNNTVTNRSQSSIISGTFNSINGSSSAIVSGNNNILNESHCTIVAGHHNTSNASENSIITGHKNTINSGHHNSLSGSINTINASTCSLLTGSTNNIANSDYTIVSGNHNIVNNSQNVVVSGNNNTVSQNNHESHVSGYGNTVNYSAHCLVAGTSNSVSFAPNSIISGDSVRVYGEREVKNVLVIGNSNTVHNEGTLNNNENGKSIVSGTNNDFSDISDSVLGGNDNTVQNIMWSNVTGRKNTVRYLTSSAVTANSFGARHSDISGYMNDVTQLESSVVTGRNNVVSDYKPHDIPGEWGINTINNIISGESNNITGLYSSVVTGFSNTVSNIHDSFIGGQHNTVSGSGGSSGAVTNSVLVLGASNNIVNNGFSQVVNGNYNTVSGERTLVSGYNLIASGNDSTVLGKFNEEDTQNSYALIVGGGTNENNRNNILALDWTGKLHVSGICVDRIMNPDGTDKALDTEGMTARLNELEERLEALENKNKEIDIYMFSINQANEKSLLTTGIVLSTDENEQKHIIGEVFTDDTTGFPTATAFTGYVLEQGSITYTINDKKFYVLNEQGVWTEQNI